MDKMKKLYEKVARDSGLQTKFAKIMEDAKNAGEEATKEKLVAFAREAGYDVSFEEAQEFFKALYEKKEGALSDEELDSVAGGKEMPVPNGFADSGNLQTLASCNIFASIVEYACSPL